MTASTRFMVAATHKSSGKTTVAIGLCAALTARGFTVQPFKKGPDYIDPMWLATASGRSCRNLDLWLTDHDEVRAAFRHGAATADVALVEGNKGLYDGLAVDGSDSNAALATLLGLPVVLVIDARGMTRGVAPLVLGYQAFEGAPTIAGVILNHVGGSRHEAKLRVALEHYTDVPVLGAVPHDDRLGIVEGHLGLLPANEAQEACRLVAGIGAAIEREVDLDQLLRRVREAASFPERADDAAPAEPVAADVRIGIAEDRAFGFYYAEDLEALRAAGATLVRFDTLNDPQPPSVDGLFLGGGFPERYARELEANAALRARIRGAIDAGLPVYAECGGLMYLARTLTTGGRAYRMVGAIPGDAVMRDRPVGRGYVQLRERATFPWPRGPADGEARAHEFHYAALENLGPGARFAYDVKRGYGIDGEHDGVMVGNVLASFAHLRTTRGNRWAERFVAFVRASEYHRRREANVVYLPPVRVREAWCA